MARFFRSVVFMALLALAFAPSGPWVNEAAAQRGEAMILPVEPAPLVIEAADGEATFSIEVADDDRKRSAGLMFRTAMDDDHGMLFVFDRERQLSFWMKNTPMPLDLIFIGEDGRIAAIMQGEPFSTAPISPGTPARFVLELKAGTAERAGIATGDPVRHPRIGMAAE